MRQNSAAQLLPLYLHSSPLIALHGQSVIWCTVVVVIFSVLGVQVKAWTPCNDAGPFILDSPSSRIIYQGETIYLFPIENGVVHSTINATISLTGVQEWSTYDANWPYGCYEPGSPNLLVRYLSLLYYLS